MTRNLSGLTRSLPHATAHVTVALLALAVLVEPTHGGSGKPDPRPDRPPAVTTVESFWVIFRERADVEAPRRIPEWAERGRAVVAALQAAANASQAGVRARLVAKGVPHRPFWIVNAIKVTGDRALRDELAARPEVAEIRPDGAFVIPEPIPGVQQPSVNSYEWNIDRIRAWQAWEAFGRGDGIVVANVDTGVDYTHPALVQQYRGNLGGTFDHGYSWFDPTGLCGGASNGPCDNYGHGTHTMGTMVGDDGQGNQVGVAPAARWIAAKGCEYGWCSYVYLMAAGQWILAPTDASGQNPRPELRPHVVNNSWGGGSGDPFYQGIVDAWVASGIFPTFSNGNGGSYCGTAGSPGDYPNSYSVGAFDYWNSIAYFSSRGPSAFGDVKPDVSAPGVDVRSTYPGSQYVWMSGTSMASPHVAGTVALMWSAASALVGDVEETRRYLDATAIDVADSSCGGTAVDNNVWGEGMLDAYAAVELSPRDPTGFLQGTVRDGGTGAPIAGASVEAVPAGGGVTGSTTTDAGGLYSIRLPIGTYAANVSAFGYSAATASVEIAQDATSVQDFALVATPTHPVSGYLRDVDGDPVPFGMVDVPGTPIAAVRTDESGFYELAAVPQGTYPIRARGLQCALSTTVEMTVDGPKVLDFTLGRKFDEYGYSCKPAPFGWVEANTAIAAGWWTWGAGVELPFPFPFYGDVYATAFVSTTGYVTFTGWDAYWGGVRIPSFSAPNAAIYPYWDKLFLDGWSSLRTELVGEPPMRQFVIEWRDLPSYEDPTARVDFEVILQENGRILTQYRNIDNTSSRETGGFATIGLENADGTIAFQYAYIQPLAVRDQIAVRYDSPPSGVVEGVVTDANDGLPIVGAAVRILQEGALVRELQTGEDGSYRAVLRLGSYELQASAHDYVTRTEPVLLGQDGEWVARGLALRTGLAVLNGPTTLDLVLAVGETRTITLDLANAGRADLAWGVREVGGAMSGPATPIGLRLNPLADSTATTTEDLYLGTPAGATPNVPGSVLRAWTPTGLSLAWGVGYTGNVWLSDAGGKANHEFDPFGTPTGRSSDAWWAGVWPADMAYDAGRKLMCQVNVGGDNGIYCWDPESGQVVDSITGVFPWTFISQRGLAYRADDDTFYVGGWNDQLIYHVKGLSHPDRGAVIGQCAPGDWWARMISGLAWNPQLRTLWVATNSEMDTIFELAPETCSVLSAVPHPSPLHNGGGLEADEAGNLWMVSQQTDTVYLVDSGVDVPWVSMRPSNGTLVPDASQPLALTIDATGAVPGVYDASLVFSTNGGREQVLRVTVRLVASAYRVGVNAGGGAYLDRAGDTWMASRLYTNGAWGHTNTTAPSGTTRMDIAGTQDDPLYQTLLQNPGEYRFDGLPPGTYQLELRFADFSSRRAGTRLFDVIVEGALALPAHDIVGEVGTGTADDHATKVVVTDGQLNVRIVEFRGSAPPIINAIRVTQRPDW